VVVILPIQATGTPATDWRPDPDLVTVEADTLPRPGGSGWFAVARQDLDVFESDRPEWSDWTQSSVVLLRAHPGGSLGGEVFRVRRFGQKDWGFVLDGYQQLWSRAYGNLRMRVTPGADLLPNFDLRLEVFQASEGGWEVSGSCWWMGFPEDDVHVAGVGLAKYSGAWYLREVTTVTTMGGTSSFSTSAFARRFFDPPWEYLEVAGGVGQGLVVVSPGPVVDLRSTRFLQGRFQRFLYPHWGISAGVSYHRFEGSPARRGLSLGMITRF
jgi:YaiO family outer membrane protein